MTNVFFGTKKTMSEAYLGESRVAVTRLEIFPMKVASVNATSGKTQVVFGPAKKSPSKAIQGHLKSSGVKSGLIREVEYTEGQEAGQVIAADIKPGTIVSVQGVTKGKGFAGAVKRWGFAGGPRTHGQSDRHRAPGSIGQGTTPGRVHRGKKMAGRMGNDTLTVKNLMVVAVEGNSIWLTGPVPGAKNGLIKCEITGQKDLVNLTFLNGYNPQVTEPAAEPTSEETKE